jgi:RNA polymerase sigma factor (sigma-70 family)
MNWLMADQRDDSCSTRPSLLERVKDRGDQQSWEEFNHVYRKLIFGFALKAGLTESEAEEVAQETLIAAAKNLPEFRYNPTICSFKTWLLNLSKWRVTDQLRKRLPVASRAASSEEATSRTATIERVPDPAGRQLEALWDEEWRTTLVEAACAKVNPQVDAKEWQMFDLYALKGWSAREVAKAVGVNIGRVYLAKHRVSRLLKNEIARCESQLL